MYHIRENPIFVKNHTFISLPPAPVPSGRFQAARQAQRPPQAQRLRVAGQVPPGGRRGNYNDRRRSDDRVRQAEDRLAAKGGQPLVRRQWRVHDERERQ